MDERLQFVARRLAGEPMADLCREFGISRKSGYKIFDRYQDSIHGFVVALPPLRKTVTPSSDIRRNGPVSIPGI